jgi:DOMON domain
MKKFILMVAVLSVLIPAYASEMAYQHTLEATDMAVSWSIDTDQIHVRLMAKTTGWVAIGFDPESAMRGADIIIGFVKNGKVEIQDHYGVRNLSHSQDETLGGKNHVLNPAGEEVDGVTTICFSLALGSREKWDNPIVPEGTRRIMVAYGSGSDSFNTGHQYRGVYDINYSTGETRKIK